MVKRGVAMLSLAYYEPAAPPAAPPEAAALAAAALAAAWASSALDDWPLLLASDVTPIPKPFIGLYQLRPDRRKTEDDRTLSCDDD